MSCAVTDFQSLLSTTLFQPLETIHIALSRSVSSYVAFTPVW
jgi:hypothetical protein